MGEYITRRRTALQRYLPFSSHESFNAVSEAQATIKNVTARIERVCKCNAAQSIVLGPCLGTDVVDMLKFMSSLVPLYCAPPQKPLSSSRSTYFESGVWSTCRLLFCPVPPSRGQVRSQELFSGGKQKDMF